MAMMVVGQATEVAGQQFTSPTTPENTNTSVMPYANHLKPVTLNPKSSQAYSLNSNQTSNFSSWRTIYKMDGGRSGARECDRKPTTSSGGQVFIQLARYRTTSQNNTCTVEPKGSVRSDFSEIDIC